jgi:hypothetical protein
MSSKTLIVRCVLPKILRPSLHKFWRDPKSGILQEPDSTPSPIFPQALGIRETLNFTEEIVKRFNRPPEWENNSSAQLAVLIAKSGKNHRVSVAAVRESAVSNRHSNMFALSRV